MSEWRIAICCVLANFLFAQIIAQNGEIEGCALGSKNIFFVFSLPLVIQHAIIYGLDTLYDVH